MIQILELFEYLARLEDIFGGSALLEARILISIDARLGSMLESTVKARLDARKLGARPAPNIYGYLNLS